MGYEILISGIAISIALSALTIGYAKTFDAQSIKFLYLRRLSEKFFHSVVAMITGLFILISISYAINYIRIQPDYLSYEYSIISMLFVWIMFLGSVIVAARNFSNAVVEIERFLFYENRIFEQAKANAEYERLMKKVKKRTKA